MVVLPVYVRWQRQSLNKKNTLPGAYRGGRFCISTYWKKRVSLFPRKRRSGVPLSLPFAGIVIIVSVALPLLYFTRMVFLPVNVRWQRKSLNKKTPSPELAEEDVFVSQLIGRNVSRCFQVSGVVGFLQADLLQES